MRKYMTHDELMLASSMIANAATSNKYAEGLTLDDWLSLVLACTRAAVGVDDYRELLDGEVDVLKKRVHGDAVSDIDAGVDDVLDKDKDNE